MTDALRAWWDRRLACIFVLGIASGFPWILFGSVLVAWTQDSGFSRTEITLLSGVGTVYALNFLWAPILDSVRLSPGPRLGWILRCLAVLAILSCVMAWSGPAQLGVFGVAAFLCAVAGATMDIAIDGYRIEILPRDDASLVSRGAGAAAAGWWTGFSLPGALAFYLADRDSIGWSETYLLFAAIWALLFVAVWFFPRAHAMAQAATLRMLQPVAEFFRDHGWRLALGLLFFIFSFKLGEAFLGRSVTMFYREVGYSDSVIGLGKVASWAVMVVFLFGASAINARFGAIRGLFIGGIAMASTNLLFAQIAVTGATLPLFAGAVVLDQFTTAFSSVALVTFLSMLTSQLYTATQYAALNSLSNLGRTSLAISSGAVVDALDGNWALFFIFTALAVLPSLMVLSQLIGPLRRRGFGARGAHPQNASASTAEPAHDP